MPKDTSNNNYNGPKERLIRYLSAAQHHQVHTKKKRHLPAQRAKWRFWIITVFAILMFTCLYGGLTELGVMPILSL